MSQHEQRLDQGGGQSFTDVDPAELAAPDEIMPPAELAGDVLPQLERRPVHPETEFKFIYGLHSIDNVTAMREQIQDANVIAIEMLDQYDDDAEKRRWAGELTELLSSATDPARRLEIAAGLDPPFLKALLTPLEGTDKKVVLIDASRDDERVLAIHDEATESLVKFKGELKAIAGTNELRQSLRRFIELRAEADRARDSLNVQRLQTIATSNEEGDPQKVAVIMGSRHTRVQHDMERQGYLTTRVFEQADETLSENQKAQWNYEKQAIRQQMFAQDRELDPALLDRALLEAMYREYPAFSYRSLTEAREYDRTIRRQVLGPMSDPEVAQLLARIDIIKATHKRNRRTSKDVAALLADNATRRLQSPEV